MRSTFSILFYINRSKIKADGTTAVMCRITIDGRNTAITSGICCKPEDWNARTGTIRTVRKMPGCRSTGNISNRLTRKF